MEKEKQPRKTKTVIIEKKNKEGKVLAKISYAKVTDRVAELHKEKTNASIKTESEFRGDYILFKATITPDVANPDRFFTGTSLGKIGFEKALEKLETLAVGRALAFAGYLADGEIASAEEIEKYEKIVSEVDTITVIDKLEKTKNLDELKTVWIGLSQAERDNEEIWKVKTLLKEKFEAIN